MTPLGTSWLFRKASRTFALIFLAVMLCTFAPPTSAQPQRLGDLDADNLATVSDVVRLINHIRDSGVGVPPAGSSGILPVGLRGYADVNGDGYLNQADVDMLAAAILGTPISTRPKPLLAEPGSGASEVGVTVRPRVYFPKPIIPATLNSNNFYASFAGRKLPARIVTANDGTFAWLFFVTNMPNASQVQVTVDGSTISVISGEILDADADLAPGGLFKFNFSTVSVVGIPNTVLTSRIVDPGPDLIPRTADDVTLGNGFNYLLPIAGVKVYVLGLESNFTYTDASGRFTLTNMPVGDVKVVLDGRTATNSPAGYYFPEMVMDTTFEPGITNGVMNIVNTNGVVVRDANGVPIRALAMYLPRVASNVLQTVSANVTNMVTLQSNAAYNISPTQQQYLTIEIMPNSLIGMDGQPLATGQVGVSVVPPELVRDMLPPGLLQHTFDITVQAPGIATFATPAPMTFPNVFNAPPGTKLNFLSFDHTTGRLVIEGTVTVSEDGLFVRTDPGTGITHPGWHGMAPPGSNARGGGAGPNMPSDTDRDGMPDYQDHDDDDDGWPDEGDDDDNGNGIPDLLEDSDMDGMPDWLDPDDDNDEIPDVIDDDDDGDGTKDVDEDNDHDGVPDKNDFDDDNDGWPDIGDPDDDNDGIGDNGWPIDPNPAPEPNPIPDNNPPDSSPDPTPDTNQNDPPVLASIANKSVKEGTLLSFQMPAFDPDGDILVYELVNGPPGAFLLARQGVFVWLPEEQHGPGTYSATVQVKDFGEGQLSDTKSFQISVSEVNRPPQLRVIGNQSVFFRHEIQFRVSAVDEDVPANALTYTFDEAPGGAFLDRTGLFRWTPQTPGRYRVTIRVTDDGGVMAGDRLLDSETFFITVVDNCDGIDIALRLASLASAATDLIAKFVPISRGARCLLDVNGEIVGLVRQIHDIQAGASAACQTVVALRATLFHNADHRPEVRSRCH